MKPMHFFGRYAALFAVLLLVVPASAHGQGFKWWMSDEYRRELSLTQDQSRRIEEIFQAALPSLRTQKKALDDEEKQFQTTMQRGNYSAVMEQVDRLEAARAALNRSRTMMLVNMRQVLTKDQWIKLDAMHQAAEQRKTDTAPSSK
jgi:Spy/CpxP family protein refolding chaperone